MKKHVIRLAAAGLAVVLLTASLAGCSSRRKLPSSWDWSSNNSTSTESAAPSSSPTARPTPSATPTAAPTDTPTPSPSPTAEPKFDETIAYDITSRTLAYMCFGCPSNTSKYSFCEFDADHDGEDEIVYMTDGNVLIAERGKKDFEMAGYAPMNEYLEIYSSGSKGLVLKSGRSNMSMEYCAYYIYSNNEIVPLVCFVNELSEPGADRDTGTFTYHQGDYDGKEIAKAQFDSILNSYGTLKKLTGREFKTEFDTGIEGKFIKDAVEVLTSYEFASILGKGDTNDDGITDYILNYKCGKKGGPKGYENVPSFMGTGWKSCCLVLTSSNDGVTAKLCTESEGSQLLMKMRLLEKVQNSGTIPELTINSVFDGEYSASLKKSAIKQSGGSLSASFDIYADVLVDVKDVLNLKVGTPLTVKCGSETKKYDVDRLEYSEDPYNGMHITINDEFYLDETTVRYNGKEYVKFLIRGDDDDAEQYHVGMVNLSIAKNAVFINEMGAWGYGNPDPSGDMHVDTIDELFESEDYSFTEISVTITVKNGAVSEIYEPFHP